MTSFLNSANTSVFQLRTYCVWTVPKHALHPRDDFVTRRVGGFVEIYDTGGNIGFEISLQWSTAIGNRSEVTCADEDCYVISIVSEVFQFDLRLL